MLFRKFHTALAIFLSLSFSAFGQVNVRDSIQSILAKDTVNAEARLQEARMLIFYNSYPEEAETLVMTVLYPFVKENWKDESQHLKYMAALYLTISFCHRERGGENRDELERFFCEKGLEAALQSGDNLQCAGVYKANAFREIKRGDTQQAHEYLYEAIKYYDKLGQYVRSSEMLYVIAGTFFDIKDLEGMQRVLQQMEEYLQKDLSKQSQYQYNVIKHSYFGLVLEQAKEEAIDYQIVDSSLLYIRKNVYLAENYLPELDPNWMHGYAYYFLAKELDKFFPQQNDSIFFYLDKSLDMIEKENRSRMAEKNSVLELKSYINQIRAKALFREGKMQDSFHAMNEALSMLDELKDYKNLSVSRHAVYQFMVEYFEKINQPGNALKFMKLLQDNEAQRYNNEKLQAINDMSAKYEAEKKEIRIQTLIRENKSVQRILWLTVILSVVLLTMFILIILFSRLKRKNIEQQLYETALFAELNQSELEKMKNAKQQSELNPVTSMIERITKIVLASPIEKDEKKTYLDQIAKIDPQLLEQAYQTANIKITGMDMKYIICFAAGIDVKDISLLFNVEPASVLTVRYRIRKKFSKENAFRMILS